LVGVSDWHLTHLSAGHLTNFVSMYVSVFLAWNYGHWSVGDRLQVESCILIGDEYYIIINERHCVVYRILFIFR